MNIAEMAREAGFSVGVGSPALEKHVAFAALVAAAEREACAKVADDIAKQHGNGRGGHSAERAANAIRARGKE